MKFINRNLIYLIIWFLMILYASLIPSSSIPKVNIPHIDKIVHFGMYGLLTIILVPFYYAFINYKQSYLFSAVTAFTIGVIIEFLQIMINTNRNGNLNDIVANLLGILTAIIVYKYLLQHSRIESLLFKI